MIDWTDRTQMVSAHFGVKELIWLPRWSRLATEADGLTEPVKANLIDLAINMDMVRDYLGDRLLVVSCFRPAEYNALVGGRPISAHLEGLAMDWTVEGMSGDELRQVIVPKLDEWQMRCEDLPGSSWVHTDRRQTVGARFFRP